MSMSDKHEVKNLFYCYSPALTHYLKASGINEIECGFNMGTDSWYCVFERTKRLAEALVGWNNFKRIREGEKNHE
jgi:hypothetical protein